jgi:hypothetical protein
MMRARCSSRCWTKAGLVVALVSAFGAGCDEDGKTAPDECGTSLEIYDIQQNPPANPDDSPNPCITPVGDAFGPPAQTGGTGQTTGGTSNGAGDTSEAGAGGR